jgi:group I intron endonuclease
MYTGIIYCAISPSKKKYYGKTVQQLKFRINGHLKNSELAICRFSSAIRKYGIENFDWIVVETYNFENRIDLRNKLNERETYLILEDKTYLKEYGYNMTNGGDGGAVFGRKLSKETCKKISNAVKNHVFSEEIKKKREERHKIVLEKNKQKEEARILKKEHKLLKKLIKLSHIEEEREYKREFPNYDRGTSRNKGKHRTEEQKEHLRIINTGKKQSQETIEKRMKTMGEVWNKGKVLKPLSKEHKEKISKGNRGKHTKKIKCLYCDAEFRPSLIKRWHNENCKFKN